MHNQLIANIFNTIGDSSVSISISDCDIELTAAIISRGTHLNTINSYLDKIEVFNFNQKDFIYEWNLAAEQYNKPLIHSINCFNGDVAWLDEVDNICVGVATGDCLGEAISSIRNVGTILSPH